ncbi:hypothetical protein HC028_08850 [Planosporangium flavigriseum]|uniref:Uncharacterized protein n=1 Tax=Planosporangium flavigriseum TaxID=373681 RepID=A0A8J3LQ04_9ACTN|nr:hypothetical protein [Planosporangium flavigriseum]NJC64613.1 hypothetical protein [Planosporangium flavigriseum]GIG71904.1 hypothetical protein Pfl04_03080 [Planosporangium flavigriseum]
MGVPHAGLCRNALYSLGILAVIAAITMGLPALDRALPRDRAVPLGVAYPVTDTVTVIPPPGALLDVSQTRPGRDSGRAVFLVGRVRFAILVSADRLTLDAAADRLRTRLRDGLGASAIATDEPAPAGARAGRFRAGPDHGWYAVRVFDATTVVDATASGPPGELTTVLPALRAAAASIARTA